MKWQVPLCASLLSVALLSSTACQSAPKAPLELSERVEWFEDARFGLFIHWGPSSIPAGEWKGKKYGCECSEWLLKEAKIPLTQYREVMAQFNPTDFNADEWADLMADSGVKYFVVTTKHHDGYTMFNADNSDYGIENTEFGRDVMKELSRAARKRDIRVGWYYSILDWQHPHYKPRLPNNNEPLPEGGADMALYKTYLSEQINQLLTDYGKIDVMWFDGEWQNTWTNEDGAALYNQCLQLQPEILVNNRVGKSRKGMQGMNKDGVKSLGDFGTPEQEIPSKGFGPGVYWESCMTMNKSWGYVAKDYKWKSTRVLLQNLCDVASKGGNYLLNIGPDATGKIPEPSQRRLREMGAWLKVNGEAIYGTQASWVGTQPWGRITTRKLDNGNTRLYLHVFNWPTSSRLRVGGISNAPITSSLLETGQPLVAKSVSGGIEVGIPTCAPDANVSVIVVDVKGEEKK